jgi:hypothetical protein
MINRESENANPSIETENIGIATIEKYLDSGIAPRSDGTGRTVPFENYVLAYLW